MELRLGSQFPPKSTVVELAFRALTRPDIKKVVAWKGVSLDYMRVTPTAEYGFAWLGGSHYIATHDIVMTEGEMSVAGGKAVSATDIRNKMTYLPAGCGVEGWSKTVLRQNTFTALYFDPGLLSEEMEKPLFDVGNQEMIYFEDRALHATMNKLEALMSAGDFAGSLYAESLALVAIIEINNAKAELPFSSTRQGKFSVSQEARLREFILDNLSVNYALTDLANVVGLSRFHFTRTFKQTFGTSPHRYVTEQRVAAAKRLLMEANLPLSHIAPAVGYGSVSQFIRAFKEISGTTPGDFRRNS
ncbi:helix-turn-helix domain-containing protein [Agrobacterium vitis]